MTPEFANAIDPIFLYVLDVLDKIGENRPPRPTEVRGRIDNLFREADAKLSAKKGWELAKFAVAAWADDVLIQAPWEGREWWVNNPLEFAYFQSNDGATLFFVKAQEAAQMTRRDILEIFYICVILGFRGLYHMPDAAMAADYLKLPPDIQSWVASISHSLQSGHGRPPLPQTPRRDEGAPPLDGRFSLVASALMASVLTILAGLTVWAILP